MDREKIGIRGERRALLVDEAASGASRGPGGPPVAFGATRKEGYERRATGSGAEMRAAVRALRENKPKDR